MLPKKEKTSKTKQLELATDGPSKKIDQTKKQQRSRLFVTITLALTIILSLSFIVYRQIKHFQSTGQTIIAQIQLKLPHFQKIIPDTSTNYPIQIDQIISQSQGAWSIYTQRISPHRSNLTWTRGAPVAIDDIHKLLDQTPSQINQSLITHAIPEGLKVAQIIDESQGHYAFLISLPNSEQLLLIFENAAPLTQIKSDIEQLSTVLYWGLISQ